MIREPAVAGQFYAGDAETLRGDVEGRLESSAEREKAFGCVCPHAGYMFSGDVAGAVLSSVEIPLTVVVLSFSHRGLGERYAVYPYGAWRTPLGDVPIDEELAAALVEGSDLLAADTRAFDREHSGEVMLPFLQVLRPDVKVVMVSVYPTAPIAHLVAVGEDIAGVIRKRDDVPLLLASSDMTHQESSSHAEKMDHLAIDQMLRLDEAGLYGVVRDHGISMCGVNAVVAMMTCVKKLGAKSARLVRYQNSGDVTGDYNHVVGYAGLIFK